MPTRETREKRRNKKRKVIKNRKPTAMPWSRYSESALRKMADFNLSSTAIVVYLYINLNCNLDTGISHQIDYDQIAEYFDIRKETVYNAITELEMVGLVSVKSRGRIIYPTSD